VWNDRDTQSVGIPFLFSKPHSNVICSIDPFSHMKLQYCFVYADSSYVEHDCGQYYLSFLNTIKCKKLASLLVVFSPTDWPTHFVTKRPTTFQIWPNASCNFCCRETHLYNNMLLSLRKQGIRAQSYIRSIFVFCNFYSQIFNKYLNIQGYSISKKIMSHEIR